MYFRLNCIEFGQQCLAEDRGRDRRGFGWECEVEVKWVTIPIPHSVQLPFLCTYHFGVVKISMQMSAISSSADRFARYEEDFLNSSRIVTRTITQLSGTRGNAG